MLVEHLFTNAIGKACSNIKSIVVRSIQCQITEIMVLLLLVHLVVSQVKSLVEITAKLALLKQIDRSVNSLSIMWCLVSNCRLVYQQHQYLITRCCVPAVIIQHVNFIVFKD